MTLTGTVAEVSGVRLRLGGHLSKSITERILSGNYEQDEVRGLSAILAPSDVVMEIGAGIGFLSSHCAKIVGSENTYAFEANPKLEPVIRDTYQLNGVSPHLEMYILAHKRRVRTFYLDENFLVSSLTSQGRQAKVVKVPATPLNAEIARIQPSMLMIDIEGGEFELFPEIDLRTVRKIVMELHPRNAEREKTRSLVADLYARGFVAYKDASHGDVLCMERRGHSLDREALDLQDAIDGLSSLQTDQSIEEVRALIPPSETIVFVDPENRWTEAELSVYRRFFFVEHDGVDWGAPGDDEAALRELDRLQANGVRYLIFLWSAFWWLETYPRLFEELQSRACCLLRNPRLIIFQLQLKRSAARQALTRSNL
jgi:FkbM family methyltransferase